MLFSGRRLSEPIAWHGRRPRVSNTGRHSPRPDRALTAPCACLSVPRPPRPIVMNTQKQIHDTFAELRRGTFPPKRVPWDYRRAAAAPKAS